MDAPGRSLYDSARVAAGYAFGRPPVHHHIIDAIRAQLDRAARLPRALDVGCGAGLSTAALHPLVRTAVGLEPIAAMLAHHEEVAPGACFVIGRAEALPFTAGAFDLVTAAGAINYADLDRCLAEIERVLAPRGVLAIYDFSAGRRFHDDGLDDWYARFQDRYPPVPGYDLDVRELPYARAGLRLERYDEMQIAIPMDVQDYLRYAMSETNVARAICGGTAEREIREWCHTTLDAVFGRATHDVLFEAYIAYAVRDRTVAA